MVCTGSARSLAEAPAETIQREYHGNSQIIAIASTIAPKTATTHSCPSLVPAAPASALTPAMVHLLTSSTFPRSYGQMWHQTATRERAR
jgi:hypothetical protein